MEQLGEGAFATVYRQTPPATFLMGQTPHGHLSHVGSAGPSTMQPPSGQLALLPSEETVARPPPQPPPAALSASRRYLFCEN